MIQDIDTGNTQFKLCDTDIPVRIDDHQRDPLSQSCIKSAAVYRKAGVDGCLDAATIIAFQ